MESLQTEGKSDDATVAGLLDQEAGIPRMRGRTASIIVKQAKADSFNVWRGIMIALCCVDVVLTVVILSIPQGFVLLGSGITAGEYEEDLGTVWMHIFLVGANIVLGIISLGLAAPAYTGDFARRLVVVALLKAAAIFLSVYEYSDRLLLAVRALHGTVIALRVITILLTLIILIRAGLRKISRRLTGFQSLYEHVAEVPHPTAFSMLSDLARWTDLQSVRRKMKHHMQRGRSYFLVACLVLYLLYFGNLVFEFKKILSTQSTFYTDEQIVALGYPNVTEYFGAQRLQQGKILLVVVDGLRADFVWENSDFRAMVTSDTFVRDSVVMNMTCQLPSMSVPNWLSIITGAPPEMTGVLGNLLIPETLFDSIFREARMYGLKRGLTGSPWFAEIVQSELPYLLGDGTVPLFLPFPSFSFVATNVGADPNAQHETADAADNIRGEITMQALTTAEPPYQLFLAHFSDVDIQGHCCGVLPKWNKENSYYSAVTNKSVIIQKLLNVVDNDTTVVIVADHGHVDRGGHGGIDPLLLNVPLIFYKKNSNLRSNVFTGPGFNNSAVLSNLDVSNTVNAILGIPVPRGGMGRYVDAAMPLINQNNLRLVYMDLAIQKQNLVRLFCANVLGEDPQCYQSLLTQQLNGTSYTPEDYIQIVNQLLDFYYTIRLPYIHGHEIRNYVIQSALFLVVGAMLLILMQRSTFASPLGLLKCHRKVMKKNLVALLWSLFLVGGYFLCAIGFYLLMYKLDGYLTWDSTVIHTPQVIPRYIMTTLVPGCIAMWVLVRIATVPYKLWSGPHTKGHTLLQRIGYYLVQALVDVRHYFGHHIGMVYLIRIYFMFTTALVILILFIAASSYTFILPNVFRIGFIRLEEWAHRFDLVTLQVVSLPLMFASIILQFNYPDKHVRTSDMDDIYMLRLEKYEASVDDAQMPALLKILQAERQTREFDLVAKPVEVLHMHNS